LPTIDLVYFNAGGGHRSAPPRSKPSSGTRAGLASPAHHLMEVLDPKDIFGKTMA